MTSITYPESQRYYRFELEVILEQAQSANGSGGTESMRKPKQFFVYIMTNGPRHHVLYTGITGNLPHRVFDHKNKMGSPFTTKYGLTHLVYYEMFCYPTDAIAREKQIKGWLRKKKLELIESMNPHWKDLAAEWQNAYKPDGRGLNGLFAPDPSRCSG